MIRVCKLQRCWMVVEVVVPEEWLKQVSAQTMMAVAATAPVIIAGLERNSACCWPAGGPAGRGAGGGGEVGGAVASVAAPPEVIPPDGTVVWPCTMGIGWAVGPDVVSCDHAGAMPVPISAAIEIVTSSLRMGP